jgi:hypothetical protein
VDRHRSNGYWRRRELRSQPSPRTLQSARLSDLLRREHNALAEFLLALSGFDHERRWAELGYASLFDYLHRDLGLSKGSAFYRMTAARLVREHPAVVEPLREGRLCLTSIVELAKVLTKDNEAEVLPRFFHLSKREAQAVTAELRPAECVPLRTVVTSVRAGFGAGVGADTAALVLGLDGETTVPGPAKVSAGTQAVAKADIGQSVQPANRTMSEITLAPAPRSERVFLEEPMTAGLSRVHLTVPRRLLQKLEAARDALSHSLAGATEAEILEAGLDLLLERQAKRRGLVKNPRKKAAECGSRHQLEIDHTVPVAQGGASTVENCRIRCRRHNDVEARRVFGDGVMDRFTRPRG